MASRQPRTPTQLGGYGQTTQGSSTRTRGPYACPWHDCDQVFRMKAGFVAHFREHSETVCMFCGTPHQTIDEREAHEHEHTSRKYQCVHCPHKFAFKLGGVAGLNLREHHLDDHPAEAWPQVAHPGGRVPVPQGYVPQQPMPPVKRKFQAPLQPPPEMPQQSAPQAPPPHPPPVNQAPHFNASQQFASPEYPAWQPGWGRGY